MAQAQIVNYEHGVRPPDDSFSELEETSFSPSHDVPEEARILPPLSSPSPCQDDDGLPVDLPDLPPGTSLPDLAVTSLPGISVTSLSHDAPETEEAALPVDLPVALLPELPGTSLSHVVPEPEEAPSSQGPEDVPDHRFQVKTTKGKSGSMKGKTREFVSLVIGNYIFRKRNTLRSGTVRFSCNGCEKLKPIKNLYAYAQINDEGKYELLEWPNCEDHGCWAAGTEDLIRQARQEMSRRVDENPSQSANKIYEDVRSSFTQNMDSDEKLMFLEKFPPFRNVAPILYRKRREHIPSDPNQL